MAYRTVKYALKTKRTQNMHLYTKLNKIKLKKIKIKYLYKLNLKTSFVKAETYLFRTLIYL